MIMPWLKMQKTFLEHFGAGGWEWLITVVQVYFELLAKQGNAEDLTC